MNNRYLQALQMQKRKTEKSVQRIFGTLGLALSGQLTVEVPGRNSYVYVQVRSSQAEVIQAFNEKVAPVYGLPVECQWQGNRYVVVGRDTMRYSDWQSYSAYLPRHAATHEFDPGNGAGDDVVYVFQRQMMPILPSPSGTFTSNNVLVNEYTFMNTSGQFSYFAPQATSNLTVWNPSSSTGAIMVLVSLDTSNDTLHYDVGSGSVFSAALTGTADVAPHIPTVPDISRYLPIGAVRLINGTTLIGWDNIYDVRQIFGVGLAGPPGIAGGMSAQDEGVPLGFPNIFNFVGAGVTATISGTVVMVNVPGGGGGSTGTSQTGTYLSLDTSNGPLTGPLLIWKSNPDSFQYHTDRSTFIAYASGTLSSRFNAAGEFIQFSTGSTAYGVYVDDEGAGGNSVFVGQQGIMDATAFRIESYINAGNASAPWLGKKWFSPMVLWNRNGNNSSQYTVPMFQMNDNDWRRIGGARQYEIDIFGSFMTYFAPGTSGSLMNNYPSQNAAAYYYDTFNVLPTGTVISVWSSASKNMEFTTPDGMHWFDGIGSLEHTGTAPFNNGSMTGKARLVAGTVTVPNPRITDSSRLFMTVQNGVVPAGFPYEFSRMAGSGFTVRSTNLSDSYEVAYLIIEPHIGR